jgi:hypothetical protein
MASITKKKVGRGLYYYARECKRVNGKPKVVWQKYLGRAEDILSAVTGAGEAQPVQGEALVTEFGAVAALYDPRRAAPATQEVRGQKSEVKPSRYT